jgi:hypothetical protein
MGEGRRRLSGYRRAQTNQSARDRSIARRAEASHGEPWLPAGVRSVRVDWQVQCLFVGSTELEGGSGAPRMAEASRGNLFSRRPVERSAARSRHFIAAGINAAYARRGSSDSSLPTELPVIGHSPRDGGVPRSSWTPSQRWRGVTAAPRGPEPLRSWHGQNEMVPASGRKPMRISNITSALTQCRERPPHPQRNLKKYVVAQGVPSGHSA